MKNNELISKKKKEKKKKRMKPVTLNTEQLQVREGRNRFREGREIVLREVQGGDA